MSIVTELASPYSLTNTAEIKTMPQGVSSGGAIVPAGQCSCNCGMLASLDCGTIVGSYYEEEFATLTYRDFWEYVDSGDTLIGDGRYIAALVFSGADNNCLPSVGILADTLDFDGGKFGRVIVNESGEGRFDIYFILLGNVDYQTAATRTGVIIGSAEGTYGENVEEGYYVTVPKSVPIEWRDNQNPSGRVTSLLIRMLII